MSDKSYLPMEDAVLSAYQVRVQRESKRVFWQGGLINFLLLLYLIWGTRQILGLTWNFLTLVWLPIWLALAFFWTRTSHSPGRNLLLRTHPVLKSSQLPFRLSQWLKTVSGILFSYAVIMTFVLGWLLTEISLHDLFSQSGIGGARNIFSALARPQWSILPAAMNAMVITIYIAFMATAMAIPPAFVLSFMMSRNLMRGSFTTKGIYNFLRFTANVTRSVEPIIWAIIFSVWVGIGPFAGMLALMLHSMASLTKLYSEQIESIDRGPMEAIEATGANKLQVIWYGVVPQIVLPFLSYTIYRWDINIRMATVIGIVGGGGIGTLLLQYQGLARWHEVGTIVILTAIVVWCMDYLSARIREAIY